MSEILSPEQNEIQYLRKALRDEELTAQAERRAAALFLGLAALLGAALIIALLTIALKAGV